jgi:putative inorganic carbon (hco3(-)) transporter
MASEMLADSPVVGKGPAGFAANYDRYLGTRLTDPPHLDVAHQMFLDVGSELGVLGLAAFVAMIWSGLRGAQRAARDPRAAAGLGAGVAVAFVGVCAAACFLSEQYYLPIWLLVALGCTIDPGRLAGRAR